VFGGRPDVAVGGVRDDDAVFGGGVDVDVVDADAGTADDDEVGCGREHRFGHFGARANDERVGVRNRLQKPVTLDIVGCFDFVARVAEPVETGVCDGIRNEYFHTEPNFPGQYNACFLRTTTSLAREQRSKKNPLSPLGERCSVYQWNCHIRIVTRDVRDDERVSRSFLDGSHDLSVGGNFHWGNRIRLHA